MKKMFLSCVLLLCTACSNSKTVKVMGPNNEVISERDQVTGWGSTADTTKTFTGREFDRCMYYMQQGSQGRAGLDARSAYQYCSTNGTSMSGMVGGYYGAGARGYIPGGGRGNVMVVPDYASGMPTTPTDVGIDPASIVTREQYDADQKRIGQAIAEERDQRLRSVKKRPK